MSERSSEGMDDRGWRWGLALAAGVLLPLAAVAIEIEGAWLGSLIASPIPTAGHVVLLLGVIASNLVCLFATPRLSARRLVPILNGVAIGVSGIYTLMFLPLMPLSLIAIVVYGLGLLGFAPLGTFAVALWCRRRLKRLALEAALAARDAPPEAYRQHPEPEPILVEAKLRGTGAGILLGLGILLALEIPPALTHHALRRATSTEPSIATPAVERLRLIGDDDVLVAACHGRRHRGGLSLLLVDGSPPSPLAARAVYYRVHGKRCPIPDGWGRGAAFFRGDGLDEDQGTDRVGGVIDTLSLTSSRMDGSIDGEAALGYVEWTLTFRNDHDFRDAEARALVALPPGGVISRVTLWIDGEEREAAFGRRGATQAAYREVVARQRDPLLVTSAGPDRALVQCFPIAARGGEMQIRIGVTFPLEAIDAARATAVLPHLLARNFATAPEAQASTSWLESESPLVDPEGAVAVRVEGRYRLRRDGVDPNAPAEVVSHRSAPDAHAVARDPLAAAADAAAAAAADEAAQDQVVEQWLEPRPTTAPSRLVVAVDTSAAMAPHATALAEVLAAIPDGLDAALVLAGDGPARVRVVGPAAMGPGARQRWRRQLAEVAWEGGRDNVPALGRAWDLASERAGAVVLWIHAAQPIALATSAPIRQRWDRVPDGPTVLHLQAGPGEDVTVAELFDQPALAAVPRRGALEDDLRRQLARWSEGATAYRRHFRRHDDPPTRETGEAQAPASKRTSDHLVRLWARGEIEALRRAGDRERATELAVRYQLVTPVSGAVVLEAAQQYHDAGLEPVDPETVPTVPEPETWALLIVMALALLIVARHRSRWSPA